MNNNNNNLKGIDALNRMENLMENMHIGRDISFKFNLENKTLCYDGKWYGVVREGAVYVLKVSQHPSPTVAEDFDYINGVKNKMKYTSKSINELTKRLNIMNIDQKRLHGESLLSEAKQIQEKYVLKVAAPQAPANLGMVDMGGGGNALADKKKSDESGLGDTSDDSLGDMDGEDSGLDSGEGGEDGASENPDDYKDVDPDELGGEVTEKSIQQLAGKLAYQLREFDDEEQYSDAAKFAVSMTTSALQTDKISDEDKASIQKKVDNQMNGDIPSEDSDSNDSNPDGSDNADELGDLEDSEENTNDPKNMQNSNESIKNRKTIIENAKNLLKEMFPMSPQNSSDIEVSSGSINSNKYKQTLQRMFELSKEGKFPPKNVANYIIFVLKELGINISSELEVGIRNKIGEKLDLSYWIGYIQKKSGHNLNEYDGLMDEGAEEASAPYYVNVSNTPKKKKKHSKGYVVSNPASFYGGYGYGGYGYGNFDNDNDNDGDFDGGGGSMDEQNAPKKRNPFKYY